MTTIEDRLRDLGRTVTPPPLPGATAVIHRARQRRRRRRGGLAAVVIAAGTGADVTARALRPDDGPTLRIAPGSLTDDGSGGWEEIPTSPTDDPGAWEEIPSDASPEASPDGSSGGWEGADTATVPDVVGLTVAQGRRALEEVGFAVQVVGDTGDGATIVSQEPAAGGTIATGSTIRIETG